MARPRMSLCPCEAFGELSPGWSESYNHVVVAGMVTCIGHAGVAFTPPYKNSRHGYLHGNAPEALTRPKGGRVPSHSSLT
jgi:hypothetical protein